MLITEVWSEHSSSIISNWCIMYNVIAASARKPLWIEWLNIQRQHREGFACSRHASMFLSSRNERNNSTTSDFHESWIKTLFCHADTLTCLIRSHRRSQGNHNCSLVYLPIVRIIRSDAGSAWKLRILTYDIVKVTLKKNGSFRSIYDPYQESKYNYIRKD